MKKFSSVALALLLTAGMLAGCGGAGNSSSTSEASQPAASVSSSQPAEESAPADETSFDNKDLSIAIFEGGYGPNYWNEIVSKFEAAYPGVKVEMQISPTIGDIIRPQIVAGTVPDFLSMNDNDQSGVVAALIKEKALMDITDVFDGAALNSDEKLRDLVTAGVLETGKCAPYGDGKVYLAPFNVSPMGMVYNKALFAENGWETPVTWDDFFALGDKAKEKGIALFTYQGIYPGYMESVIWPAIGSAVGPEGFKKITSYQEGAFNNPETIAVLENLQKIATGGYLMEGTVALNHTQSQTDMMMNKALFIPNGNWMEGEMAEAPRADGFEFGLTPAPVLNADDTRYVMTSVEQFSIPAQAKNPELAKEFLRFLYTDDSVKLFAQEANGIYALKTADSLVKGTVTDGVYNMNQVYEVGTSMVVGFDAIPQGSKIVLNDEVFNPLTDVMNGTMTVQQWVDGMEAAYAQIRTDAANAK